MHITICGHAALYIETPDQHLLVDPCFSDSLVEGTVVYNPGRVLETEKMPPPTALVITHGHFDHFHLESLQRLPRDVPVITAKDPHVVQQLGNAGFSTVIACEPWQSVELGKTRLLTTPSAHDEPEFGLLFQHDSSGTFWHMADAEVTGDVGRRLVREHGPINLISAKYQPVVRASIGYLRGVGAAFDKHEVAAWLEAACICEPALIFPYASGLCFSGRHAWFNRYAFPLGPEEVVRMLQRRLGSQERATVVRPGDVIELRCGERPIRHPQESPFVRECTSPELRWEPVDTTTLAGLDTREERQVLQRELEAFLHGPLASWLEQTVGWDGSISNFFRSQDGVWQLVAHAGDGQRLNYFIDFRSGRFSASPGEHNEANFFTHIAGRGLYEVLQGVKPGLIFWLAGEVRSYEKIMGVRAGRFWFPKLAEAPEDWMCDPLTYYLRHFGTAEISVCEPELKDLQPSMTDVLPEALNNVEVFAREGENPMVMSKKALLAYLAAKEAKRLGLEISDDEIQAASDDFRRRFGLHDQETMIRWLENAGLSLEEYSAVIRDFVAVLRLEKHYSGAIEPLFRNHRRVATARDTPLPRMF